MAHKEYRYEYRCPLSQGYTRVRISKAALCEAGIRTRHRFGSGAVACYFHPEKGFYFEHCTQVWAKALAVCLFPVSLLLGGVLHIKNIWGDLCRLVQERRYGAFTTDRVQPGQHGYDELLVHVGPTLRASQRSKQNKETS